MGKKDSEVRADTALPSRKGNSRDEHYPMCCRVTISILSQKNERSRMLGPGTTLTYDEYSELLEGGFVRPEWFEPSPASSEKEPAK